MIDLDPKLLRTLLAVHRHGTVTAAAEAVGYTPSAVSQQLARLEADVGVSLTRKAGRNIELTASGLALAEEAPGVLAAIERAKSAATRAGGVVSGSVRLGTFQSAAVALIPSAVRHLESRYPDVSAELVVQETRVSLEDLAVSRVDIVLDQNYEDAPRPPRPDAVVHALMTDELVVCIPEDLPEPRSIVDLSDQRWILPHPDTNLCGRVMIDRCRSAGFEPSIPIWSSDYLLGLQLAAAGLGIAMVSAIVAPNPPEGFRYHRFDPPVIRELSALTRTGTQRAAVGAVVESLVRAAADLEAVTQAA